MNNTPLITKKAVGQLALEMAKQERGAQPFTRVGASFYIEANSALRRWMRDRIKSLPSKGVTIR